MKKQADDSRPLPYVHRGGCIVVNSPIKPGSIPRPPLEHPPGSSTVCPLNRFQPCHRQYAWRKEDGKCLLPDALFEGEGR